MTPPLPQLEQRVDDSFPQTTHSPKAEGGAVELEEDMLRVFECSGAETERLERVTRESEGKERERRRGEKGKVGNSRTAESPVDPKPNDNDNF